MNLTDSELRFARRAIQRKKLFLVISICSVAIGLGFALLYIWQYATQPDFAPGIHFVVVLLILFVARQNLRQHLYARVLEKLLP